MQTSPVAERIAQVAHSTRAVPTLLPEQIVAIDTRLRGWKMAQGSTLGYAHPQMSVLNADGELVQIRTLNGNTLELRYATPASNFGFSANTISQNALAGSGVDLFADGNTLDAFWFASDGVHLKTARSTDGGHTWGSASTVATLPAQGSGVLPQLCAPAQDTVVYTDSTVGVDENNDPLTALYITLKVSSAWITPVLWDLGGQAMGVEQKVTLPNGDLYPSNLSGLALSDTRIELAYFSSALRESPEDGTYVQRIANLNYGSATQRLHFATPKEIFQSIAIDDDNESTQIFSAFPRLQRVGDEYWILALEASEFAEHERYHLAFFRSTDGIVWSDRDYRQGAGEDDPTGAYVYGSGDIYDDVVPFTVTDLIYANLIVTEEFTYIVGFDKVFYCPSTLLVGVENPDRELDLTGLVPDWTVNLPAAPGAGNATYTLGSVPKRYDGSDILTAHRGVIIRHRAGYRTTVYDEDELIDLATFHVDQINQETAAGRNDGTIQCQDDTLLLERWKADKPWEYQGSDQVAFDMFCDLSPFIMVQGSWKTNRGGIMSSGIVRKSDNFRDDINSLNIHGHGDNCAYMRFLCRNTFDNNHVGVVFNGRQQGDGDDNKTFWAVLYNRTANKFTLNRATPRTNVNRVKLYNYSGNVAASSTVTLTNGVWYWMRWAVWHGHLMVWYSTDSAGLPSPTWTLVLDYTSPASPASSVMPCRIGWAAVIGTQRVNPSGAIGQLSAKAGMQSLPQDRIIARRIPLGGAPSYLRSVNVYLTQENTDAASPMPDAVIMLAAGDDTTPADLTDDDNIIFSTNSSALRFSNHNQPTGLRANARPNLQTPAFDANDNVWIAVTIDGALTTGQTYKWAANNTGNLGTDQTLYSDDGGATWQQFTDHNLDMACALEVEYKAGRIIFSNLYYATGENIHTYEELAHEIAAKSGVLDINPFDWVSQADMSLKSDGFYWQPADFGTLGDLVLDVDANISGTGRVFLGASAVGLGDSLGFIVELDPTTQLISYYAPGNVALSIAKSLQYIPLSRDFHLQIVNQDNFLYVYINECLAAIHYDPELSLAGYVGFDPTGVTFTNLRIPDLHQTVKYFAIQPKQTATDALGQLVAKPAPGTIARGKYFIRYNRALRIGSFTRREVVDTYQSTLFRVNKSETQRYAVTQLSPQGARYAIRWFPDSLDTDGRIFDQQDYTDAFTDADAYTAATDVERDAKEKALTLTIDGLANYAAEREDLIIGRNPVDYTNGLFIINSLSFHGSSKPETTQAMGVRQFVGDEVS